MKKIDNRGVTLVELIIVMALAAIVSLMAFSFLQDTTHFYNLTSAEVDIQMEAQTTYSQIRDLVMNTEVGVVAFGMDSDVDRKLNVDGKEYKALVVYNNNNIKAVIYDPSSKKIYLVEDVRSEIKFGNQAQIDECTKKISDENLMSEGVSLFDVVNASELNQESFDGILKMKLKFTKKSKSNTYESYVTLRNDTVSNPDRGYK